MAWHGEMGGSSELYLTARTGVWNRGYREWGGSADAMVMGLIWGWICLLDGACL